MSEKHTPEMKACEAAFKRLLAVDVTGGLQLVTGLFVGLVVELAKRNGNDPDQEIRIDGGGKRDITIHAPATRSHP